MFYESDFIRLYHGPIILYLLWLCATIGLFRMDHAIAKRLLEALCFIVCAVMIGVNAWAFTEDHTVQAIYYPYNLSLWLSLSLLLSSVLTTVLVIQSDAKARPRFCCALLFVLVLCCVLLSGASFLASLDFGFDYPCWYLGQLLLYLLAVAGLGVLARMAYACARPFIIVLACIVSVAAIGVYIEAGAMSDAFPANADPAVPAFWFALPIPVFAAFAWWLAWRQRRQCGR